MITADEAIKAVCDYFNDGDESHFKGWGDTRTPTEKEHGSVVGYRFEAYHDVMVYEDGYEERFYIGD